MGYFVECFVIVLVSLICLVDDCLWFVCFDYLVFGMVGVCRFIGGLLLFDCLNLGYLFVFEIVVVN